MGSKVAQKHGSTMAELVPDCVHFALFDDSQWLAHHGHGAKALLIICPQRSAQPPPLVVRESRVASQTMYTCPRSAAAQSNKSQRGCKNETSAVETGRRAGGTVRSRPGQRKDPTTREKNVSSTRLFYTHTQTPEKNEPVGLRASTRVLVISSLCPKVRRCWSMEP
jgi:hypothetical protein